MLISVLSNKAALGTGYRVHLQRVCRQEDHQDFISGRLLPEEPRVGPPLRQPPPGPRRGELRPNPQPGAQPRAQANRGQVWSLTQFFSVPFCEKSMIPHRGNTILFRSSQQLPRLRLGPSKGFLSWHGALLEPSTCLVRCFPNYRDTRTPSTTTDANLDCAFVENALFTSILYFEKSTE